MPGAALQGKCPRCGKGAIFTYPLSHFSKFSVMNSRCSNCEAPFEPEPGFYFGALYVSYGFNIMLLIGIWAILYFTIDPAMWVYGVSLVVASFLFIPISFRLSRILFLRWFGGL